MPALALEVHRVEHLRAHVALGDGVRELEDAVGERRLAVVDVRDDREVADAVLGPWFRRASERPGNASSASSSRTLSARHVTQSRRRCRRRAPATTGCELAGANERPRAASSSATTCRRRAPASNGRRRSRSAATESQISPKLEPAEPAAHQDEQRRPLPAMLTSEVASGMPQVPNAVEDGVEHGVRGTRFRERDERSGSSSTAG